MNCAPYTMGRREGGEEKIFKAAISSVLTVLPQQHVVI